MVCKFLASFLLMGGSLAAGYAIQAGSSPDQPSKARSEAFGAATGYRIDEAATEAICSRVADLEPPIADLPTPAEAVALNGCDSEALYYGIGMPADPVKARKCAFTEGNPKGESLRLHNEDGMLMMVYLNGRGVERNYDLAIHYACELGDSLAARDLRVRDLDQRRKDGWRGIDFESCEHITSGSAQGYCAAHDARLAEQQRQARITALARSWTAAQRSLFDEAYWSAKQYFSTLHEMDCFGGTAAAACTIIGSEKDLNDFLARVEGISRGKAIQLEVRTDARRRKLARNAISDKDRSWLPEDQRAFFDENDRESADTRLIFERRLVLFFRQTFPSISSHRIRRIFADM